MCNVLKRFTTFQINQQQQNFLHFPRINLDILMYIMRVWMWKNCDNGSQVSMFPSDPRPGLGVVCPTLSYKHLQTGEEALHCSPLLSTALHCITLRLLHHRRICCLQIQAKTILTGSMTAKQSKSVQTLMRMLCSVSILAVGCHTAPQVWSIVHEDYQYLTNSFAHT